MSGELKQMCQKYESDIQTLTAAVEELTERNSEIENILKEKESLLLSKESSWEKMESQYKTMLLQAQEQAKTMELSLNAIKRENEKNSSLQAKEKDGRVEEFQN